MTSPLVVPSLMATILWSRRGINKGVDDVSHVSNWELKYVMVLTQYGEEVEAPPLIIIRWSLNVLTADLAVAGPAVRFLEVPSLLKI
jgi:hypothetical protein